MQPAKSTVDEKSFVLFKFLFLLCSAERQRSLLDGNGTV